MKFKVGDKVKIKDDLIVGNKYGCDTYIKEMEDFCKGNILTITGILDDSYKKGYYIKNCFYLYTDEMLEPVETKETIEVKLNNLTEYERKTLLDLVDKSNKKSKRFKPNIDDTYWIINIWGNVDFTCWNNTVIDNQLYNTNNCFETLEEAEFMAKKKDITSQLEILAIQNNDELQWKDCYNKYYLYFACRLNQLLIEYNYDCNLNLIYFTSKEVLKKAIKDIGEENIIKYYFGTYKKG